jgi:hypothetical protein
MVREIRRVKSHMVCGPRVKKPISMVNIAVSTKQGMTEITLIHRREISVEKR